MLIPTVAPLAENDGLQFWDGVSAGVGEIASIIATGGFVIGNSGTFSTWINVSDITTPDDQCFLLNTFPSDDNSLNDGLFLRLNKTSRNVVLFGNRAGASNFSLATGNNVWNFNQWLHLYVAWSCGNAQGQIAINSSVIATYGGGAQELNQNTSRLDINLRPNEANSQLPIALFDTWLSNNRYEASAGNMLKFYDSGNAVNLGFDGKKPFGVTPNVFLSGGWRTWQNNKGSNANTFILNNPTRAIKPLTKPNIF